MPSLAVTQKVVLPGNVEQLATTTVQVDAYDVIEATIPASGADVEVEVMPASPEKINILMIKPDSFTEETPGTPDLSFKPGSSGSVAVPLNSPALLNGAGLIGALEAVPGSIFFSNLSTTVDHVVTILVGRNATP